MPAVQPLRLLHMVGSPKAGGAETFARRLLISLHAHPGVELRVLVRRNSWMSAQLKAAGVPVEELPFGGLFDFSTARKARALAQAFQPHVVTSWMNRATRFLPKGPWVNAARLGGYYNLKYYRGKADVLIGNTEDICAYCIKNGWPEAAVRYLPNFVPEPPKGWQSARAATRTAWGVAESDTVLLQAGRLHTNKAVDVALHAMAHLPHTCHLMLAGQGPEEAALRTLATQLGIAKRVHFLGWVDDLDPVAAGADIWLAPSRFEPLGNTVLDGWMHSLPVVAAASAGPKSLITPGKNGLLVPIDDAEALASAIATLQEDPIKATAMAKAGFATGRGRFGEKAVVEAYLSAYKSMVENC